MRNKTKAIQQQLGFWCQLTETTLMALQRTKSNALKGFLSSDIINGLK